MEIIVLSYIIIRPICIKIINRSDKNWGTFLENKAAKDENKSMKKAGLQNGNLHPKRANLHGAEV